MATYNPPIKNAAYEFYVGLVSAANTHEFQSNPTLASGDAKVSKDGGALANLTTLPSAVGSGKVVKINLSSTEMNADNVTVILSDQTASEEWCDLIINIQPLTWVPANVTYISGSAVSTTTAQLGVNVVQISGDSTAADNAEAMFDGTGYAGGTAKLTVDVSKWNGTAVATPATAGYPAVTVKVGTGTGELNTSGGSLAVTVADGGLTEAKFSSGALNAIADAILKRDFSSVSGEAARSLLNAARFLRNKWSVSGGTLTVTKENDTTTAWTAALTDNAAANPITGSDPI